MSSGQEVPISPARAHIESEQENASSHSSHELIDSKPTSPSHSTTASEDLKTLSLTEQDPTTTNSEEETNTDPDTNTDTEQELFKDPEPIKANADEIREFGRLAQELSLFASCIGVPPPPTPATPDNPIACTSSSLHSKLLDPYTDADKTPTQASSSASPSQAEADAEAAALQAAHAEAVIAQRKAELQADLLELIQNEADGRNRDLILEIENLMRDWKGLHERLERWRGEKKGEKVREMYKRDMEE
ncbi:hypothetical protein IFR04_000219 [Cadophora malorum]|uniref:Uncharacterized protein n=1 Tax=Cadophora malorum TaxID=108018 RepID=A0A8H8BX07_9HELO|nr:hypothetical protein IFR04_000219 [Cadophora malorum]